MTQSITVTPKTQMGDILRAYPAAQRALFQKYHIGGCSSCGFSETDALQEVCGSHNITNVQEVIDVILQAQEMEKKIQISAKEAAQILETQRSAKLLDVRGKDEWELAHIDGAMLVTEQSIDEIMTWPKETPLLVHCHHGMRSLDASAYLLDHGFTNVKSITGGIDAWSLEVDPKVPRY